MVALGFVQLQKGKRIWLIKLIPPLGGIFLGWRHRVLKWGKIPPQNITILIAEVFSKCPKMFVIPRTEKKTQAKLNQGKIPPQNVAVLISEVFQSVL